MAPSTAMVTAGETRFLMVSHVIAGTCAAGSWLLIENRSPMVSIVITPANCLSNHATIVITIMAISEPGTFSQQRGITTIITTLDNPTIVLQKSIELKFAI